MSMCLMVCRAATSSRHAQAGTLLARLGLEALIGGRVRAGSALSGRKIPTVVTAMMVGMWEKNRDDTQHETWRSSMEVALLNSHDRVSGPTRVRLRPS